MPFKKLKGVEDVDNLEFQVKEGVDWDEEAREANNNDRLSEGKSRKPSTFLKRDGDVLKHAADEGKQGELVEVDPVKVEEDKQLPASPSGDESGKASGERSQNSENVKDVPIEVLQKKDEKTVATKDEESKPVVDEVKEPEEVPLEEAGKGDDEEKEKSVPRGNEGDEPSGKPDVAGVADPESESKPEKAFGVAKDGEKALPKGVVGEAASRPEETLLRKAGNEEKEHKIDAADKKAKLDDFERKVMSKNEDARKEGEGVQDKEAVKDGEAEKDEERQILERKFIEMQEEASSTDDGEGRTSSSDGDVKNLSPDNKDVQESDGPPVDNEADAGATNPDEKRPAWVADFPEGVMKKRDEEALKLLEELSHSAEDGVEESR